MGGGGGRSAEMSTESPTYGYEQILSTTRRPYLLVDLIYEKTLQNHSMYLGTWPRLPYRTPHGSAD